MAAGFGPSKTANKRFGGIHSIQPMQTTPDDQARSSKDLYQKVLRTIDLNTGGKKPPSMRTRELGTILVAHADVDGGRLRSTLQAAERNGAIMRWKGPDGQPRVCLTDRRSIAQVHNHERQKDHPNHALIDACRTMLEDDDDA